MPVVTRSASRSSPASSEEAQGQDKTTPRRSPKPHSNSDDQNDNRDDDRDTNPTQIEPDSRASSINPDDPPADHDRLPDHPSHDFSSLCVKVQLPPTPSSDSENPNDQEVSLCFHHNWVPKGPLCLHMDGQHVLRTPSPFPFLPQRPFGVVTIDKTLPLFRYSSNSGNQEDPWPCLDQGRDQKASLDRVVRGGHALINRLISSLVFCFATGGNSNRARGLSFLFLVVGSITASVLIALGLGKVVHLSYFGSQPTQPVVSISLPIHLPLVYLADTIVPDSTTTHRPATPNPPHTIVSALQQLGDALALRLPALHAACRMDTSVDTHSRCYRLEPRVIGLFTYMRKSEDLFKSFVERIIVLEEQISTRLADLRQYEQRIQHLPTRPNFDKADPDGGDHRRTQTIASIYLDSLVSYPYDRERARESRTSSNKAQNIPNMPGGRQHLPMNPLAEGYDPLAKRELRRDHAAEYASKLRSPGEDRVVLNQASLIDGIVHFHDLLTSLVREASWADNVTALAVIMRDFQLDADDIREITRISSPDELSRTPGDASSFQPYLDAMSQYQLELGNAIMRLEALRDTLEAVLWGDTWTPEAWDNVWFWVGVHPGWSRERAVGKDVIVWREGEGEEDYGSGGRDTASSGKNTSLSLQQRVVAFLHRSWRALDSIAGEATGLEPRFASLSRQKTHLSTAIVLLKQRQRSSRANTHST